MADDWYTPERIVDALQEAVGGFDLDPAAGCEPDPIAPTTYTKDDDGTAQPWFGKVFVNPPYSRGNIDAFAKKMYDESRREGGPELIIALLPVRMSADWWHNYVNPADLMCVFDQRIRFGGAENDGGFASALAVYGDPNAELIETFDDWGAVYKGHEIPCVGSVGWGSVLSIRTDSRSIAHPEGVDPVAEAVVESARVTDDGLVEVMAIQPAGDRDHETYFLLEFPRDDPIDLRCAVSRGIRDAGFRHVAIEGVEPVSVRETHRDPTGVYA